VGAVLRFLIYAVLLVVTLYALIDAILVPGALARSLPKWLWLVLIVVVPFFGAVAWLAAGRPTHEQVPAGDVGPLGRVAARRSTPQESAPDDDPAFLRKLADDEWSRRMRDRRRGATPDTDDLGPDVP
jgi:predicted membrane metal-binding protein